MFKTIKENPKSFALAVTLHVVMVAMLSLSLDWTSTHKVATPEVEVIQAVMVDEGKVQAEMKKLELAEQKKRQQEEARQQQLDKKAKDAERKRKEEEKRIKDLEQKRAEQKRLAEKEAKKQKELRKKREQEEKRLAELERKRKIEVERQRKAEEEAKRRAEEERIRKEQIAAEQKRLEAIRQQELNAEEDRYIRLIQQKVLRKWVRPSSWQQGAACEVKVRLVPGAGGGQVISANVVKSCGQPFLDRSVEAAVNSASPLPIPSDVELANRFREITFEFKAPE